MLYKALDAVLTSSLAPKRAPFGYVRSILTTSSYYEKVRAITNLFNRLIPPTGRYLSQSLYRPTHLPFVCNTVELLAYGSGATVFLLKSLDSSNVVVLKIYRRSLGLRSDRLPKLVNHFRDRYQTILSWYADCEIVLPIAFLILHAPLLRCNALACVQPFINTKHSGFFEDFSDDELVSMFMNDASLKKQFTVFADRTLTILEEKGLCIDLVGTRNLLLMKGNANAKIRLIDFGIIDVAEKRCNSAAAYQRLNERIDRLKLLLSRIETFA